MARLKNLLVEWAMTVAHNVGIQGRDPMAISPHFGSRELHLVIEQRSAALLGQLLNVRIH